MQSVIAVLQQNVFNIMQSTGYNFYWKQFTMRGQTIKIHF